MSVNVSLNLTDLNSNNIIMENLRDMMLHQIGKDKFGYVDIVTEGVASTGDGSYQLLSKLYNEVSKIEQVDFGTIPDSKGDITKYKYYTVLSDSIKIITELTKSSSKKNHNVDSLNKLHSILLQSRNDFTWGYKSNNFIIISTYNTMVKSLHEMINVGIVEASSSLREKASGKPDKVMSKNKIRSIVNNTDNFIKLYESGQWKTLMNAFKSSGHEKILESLTKNDNEEYDPVYEDLRASFSFGVDTARNATDAINNTAKNINLFNSARDSIKNTWKSGKTEIPKALGNAKNWMNAGHSGLKKTGAVVAALIALLMIIRKAIYLFFNKAGDVRDSIKDQTEFIKASIANENDPNGKTPTGLKVYQNSINKIADVIDYNILKSEKEADKDIEKSDAEDFNPGSFNFNNNNDYNNISGNDFEF